MELTGMHVTGITRLVNSHYGNPRFDVAFVDSDGKPHSYRTQSDAAVSYDVENIAGEHYKHPAGTVTVKLSPAGRITYMTREQD
jgi:hypothetical protein